MKFKFLWAAVGWAALSTLGACAAGRANAAEAPAAAQPMAAVDLDAALRGGDPAAVRRIASDPHRTLSESALAAGALANWLRQDEQADAALTRSAADSALPDALRRRASILLSGLRLRQGRYAEAVAALDAALPGVTAAHERTDLEQTRAFAAALVSVAPMQATVPEAGSVPLTRDLAQLNRGPVAINDGAVDAIIDTGSAVSSISESEARRLGLRMLEGQVSVGTATAASASGKLAVADRLSFGGAEFRNVVFLVMPDEAFTFANGAYVVHAIIGLPILEPLGRVTYSTDSGAESLSFRRTRATPNDESNLILEGDVPFTFAHIDGASAPVRLFIDNGAKTGHLNQRFVTEFPGVIASAHRQSVTRTGGAGSEMQDAMQLPQLVLAFGQATAALTNVDVVDDHQTDRHGTLGLDALRTAPGYVLDFDAMRFDLLARANP